MKLLVKPFTPLFDIVKFTWTKRGPPPGEPIAAKPLRGAAAIPCDEPRHRSQ